MIIDSKTGLPALPEGWWWEVKEEKHITKWVAEMALYDFGYQVQIRCINTKTADLRKKHWWSKKETWVDLPAPVQYEATLKSEWITKADVDVMGSADISPVITKKAVLNAARRCKIAFDRTWETQNLVGKYPPNTLTEKVDNA